VLSIVDPPHIDIVNTARAATSDRGSFEYGNVCAEISQP
jgi:hypothetical protein